MWGGSIEANGKARAAVLDGHYRKGVDKRTTPVGAALARLGVTANSLTLTGLVFAVADAFAIGSGHLLVGLVLLVPCGLPDLFDGPVAKASGTASVRGAFLDSVSDRVSDSLLMGGVAWYLFGHGDPRAAILAFAVLGFTFLVSYERAKAESLGLEARGGLMERAERMVLLGVGLLSASFLVPVLWVMASLTSATAVFRFAMVWRQCPSVERARLAGEAGGRSSEARWRVARVESRWRAWREAAVTRPERPRKAGAVASRWRARRRGTWLTSGRVARGGARSRARAGSRWRQPHGPR